MRDVSQRAGKSAILHESGAPHAYGCGQFSATFSQATIKLLYETVVSGGRELVMASLVPRQSCSYQTIVPGPVCIGNVLAKSPLALLFNPSDLTNHIYWMDTSSHVYRNCTIVIN